MSWILWVTLVCGHRVTFEELLPKFANILASSPYETCPCSEREARLPVQCLQQLMLVERAFAQSQLVNTCTWFECLLNGESKAASLWIEICCIECELDLPLLSMLLYSAVCFQESFWTACLAAMGRLTAPHDRSSKITVFGEFLFRKLCARDWPCLT